MGSHQIRTARIPQRQRLALLSIIESAWRRATPRFQHVPPPGPEPDFMAEGDARQPRLPVPHDQVALGPHCRSLRKGKVPAPGMGDFARISDLTFQMVDCSIERQRLRVADKIRSSVKLDINWELRIALQTSIARHARPHDPRPAPRTGTISCGLHGRKCSGTARRKNRRR